ncbi:MAG: hypothetical protein OHK0031_05110 [Anaerolineales bacterium]
MKVLITRPRAQAADFAEQLRQAGFEPILFPVIEIRPVENNAALETALANLEKYAWLIFTSVNAVPPTVSPHFLRKWGESPAGTRGVKIAAVGPKTAAALRQRNIEPDFIPDEFRGEAIFAGLGDLRGKWILLPRAELARPELPAAIAAAGGIAHEIIVYRTLPAEIDSAGLAALKSGVDVITFTSASCVENFVEIARQNQLDPLHLPNAPKIACIGPVTGQAARAAGFENVVVAKEFTSEGLVAQVSDLRGKSEICPT